MLQCAGSLDMGSRGVEVSQRGRSVGLENHISGIVQRKRSDQYLHLT